MAIRRRQTRALLFALSAESTRVSRSWLCDLLWPDAPESVARRHLSHVLTHRERLAAGSRSWAAQHDWSQLVERYLSILSNQ